MKKEEMHPLINLLKNCLDNVYHLKDFVFRCNLFFGKHIVLLLSVDVDIDVDICLFVVCLLCPVKGISAKGYIFKSAFSEFYAVKGF